MAPAVHHIDGSHAHRTVWPNGMSTHFEAAKGLRCSGRTPQSVLLRKTPRSATFCSGPFSLARFLSPSAVPEIRRRPSRDSTRTSFAHLARSCSTAFVEEGAARQL